MWKREGNKVVGYRIKTKEVTPEAMDLVGCWRIAAVERTEIDLSKPREQQTSKVEISYYVSSCPSSQLSDQQLLEAIFEHWASIENGVHRTRDMSLGEDACKIGRPVNARPPNGPAPDQPKKARDRTKAARNMVTLRNLVIGMWNLQVFKKRTKAVSLPSFCRQMTASRALRIMKKR